MIGAYARGHQQINGNLMNFQAYISSSSEEYVEMITHCMGIYLPTYTVIAGY